MPTATEVPLAVPERPWWWSTSSSCRRSRRRRWSCRPVVDVVSPGAGVGGLLRAAARQGDQGQRRPARRTAQARPAPVGVSAGRRPAVGSVRCGVWSSGSPSSGPGRPRSGVGTARVARSVRRATGSHPVTREPDPVGGRLMRSRLLGAAGRGETSVTARVRPITVMAATAVVVAGAGRASFAWTRDDDDGRRSAGLAPDRARRPGRGGHGPGHHHRRRAAPTCRGPGLADPGGSLAAWSVPPPSADPAAVRRLADAFGVSGDLRRIDGGWQIGADGEADVRVATSARRGAGPTRPAAPRRSAIGVRRARHRPTLPGLTGPGGPGRSTSTSSGDVGVDGCTSTPAPEGVPTAAEAEDATRDLLRRAGLDVGAHAVHAASSDVGRAGRPRPRSSTARPTRGIDTVSRSAAQGAVTSASGWLGQPTKGDTYPLIGIDAAIGRLNDGRDVLDGLGADAAAVGLRRPTDAAATASGSVRPTTVPSDRRSTVARPTIRPRCHDAADDVGLRRAARARARGGRAELGRRPCDDHHGRRRGDGDAGGSGGGGPGCPGSVCPAPPCPPGMACAVRAAPSRPATRPRAPIPTPGRRSCPSPLDPPPAAATTARRHHHLGRGGAGRGARLRRQRSGSCRPTG